MDHINQQNDVLSLRFSMNLKWKTFVYKTAFWMTGEIVLNILGLDNVADYSEFLFGHELELSKKNHRTVKLSCLKPKFCDKINENCPVDEVALQFSDSPLENCITNHQIFFKKCTKIKHYCIKASLFSDLSYNLKWEDYRRDS
ncbi:hypothetical protein [Crocosphaera chwakensis]|uniref:Uncharacterized protein n=1 Tax=Crocosphaera chwakensis CCY0110 TaxID=391612 RepID=A3IL41_9CHRO|nr:hypothetical protein [Crocosphaera chwakensis]EAZ92910.1 hypothetical protein CY0110_22477 [Crocosphaera chwakensis CCY0110]